MRDYNMTTLQGSTGGPTEIADSTHFYLKSALNTVVLLRSLHVKLYVEALTP